MQRYRIKLMTFPEHTTYHNADWGDILVGGDKGDVYIDSAGEEQGKVVCHNLTLETHDLLSGAEVEETVRDIVESSYMCVGSETFFGQSQF